MKILIVTIIFLAAAIVVGKYTFATFVYNREDPTTVVENSVDIKPLPETKGIPPEVLKAIAEKSEEILVRTPAPTAEITTPLIVSGLARGSWFFEGSFPVVVTDWNGLVIGEGFVTAQTNWMTEEFVPFTGTIEFTVSSTVPYNRGAVIFKKDNPSGLPENDDALEIPVVFSEV